MNILNILREQKGSVLIFFTLGFTFFLGMSSLVIDVAFLYLNKTKLSNMVDSAALAGALDLPKNSTDALESAYDYADMNGLTSDNVTASVGSGNKSLTVTASRDVKLFFASLLGVSHTTINASATATISAIGAATGVVPFGLEKQSFVYGQTYTLKEGGGSGYCGNYGALALGGNGGSNYRSNIENGYSDLLRVGDWVSTEPGNMVGPTDQGVSYRINQDPTVTFSTVQQDSPRIVIIPIIDSLDVNGRKPVQIVGFAAFFLEASNRGVVTGKFMQICSSNNIPGNGTSYGLYSVRLSQ